MCFHAELTHSFALSTEALASSDSVTSLKMSLLLDSGTVITETKLTKQVPVQPPHHCSPQAHFFVHLVTPEAYATPTHWVCARLYCRLLDDLLESDTYFARLASTTYSLSCSETGLVLHFQVGSTDANGNEGWQCHVTAFLLAAHRATPVSLCGCWMW